MNFLELAKERYSCRSFAEKEVEMEKIEKIFKGDFEQLALRRRFPKLYENTEKLSKEINKSISAYKKSISYWDEKQPCVRSHDVIREKLNELIAGKVGPPPEKQTWLSEIYKEGEERFKNKIPPGYKDFNKSKSEDSCFVYDGLKYERQYGDLILWKQLIEKAKDTKVKNVIFVTDDSKEDWWYILDSRGKKQIGPHANLQSEIYRECRLDLFHMYNTSTFLESGKKILNIGVHDSSIKDANTIFLQSLKDWEIKLRDREIEKDNIVISYPETKLYRRYLKDIELKYHENQSSELEKIIKFINDKNLFHLTPLEIKKLKYLKDSEDEK